MRIEKAKPGDIPEMLSIYNHYIMESTATFHLEAIDESRFKKEFFHDDGIYSSYVIKKGTEIIGFCTLSQFNSKEAYRRSAYVSIYLDKENVGRGYGARTVDFLEKEAAEKGIASLIALICSENSYSVRMFEKKGYRLAGKLEKAGEKFGRLLDVVYYQKLILK